MQDLSLLEAALHYIRCGYGVAPGFSPPMVARAEQLDKVRNGADAFSKITYYFLRRVCKTPLRLRFILQPITTEKQAVKWFGRYQNANLLIALGKRSNIVAMDIDFSSPDRGVAIDANAYRTRKVSTGNGIHCYFGYPEDIKWTRHVTAEGIYVKGDKCWMHAPPSLHANGKSYYWLDDTSPIAELPAEFRTTTEALLSRLHLFTVCVLAHNFVHMYLVYPCLKLVIAARFPVRKSA
jgi:hypothetical protein